MLCVIFVSLSIIVGSSLGRPDGVKGCGTPEASFVPIHGNSDLNESLPVYIRALRNDTDWSVLIWTEGISYKGFYLRVFSNVSKETARGNFVEVPPKSRACSPVDACHTSSSINRTSETFIWRIDPGYHGNVYFNATIVITYKDGYKILSSRQKDAVTPESEKENGTIGIQEVYKQCGVSLGCLSQCNSDSCSHLITWERREQFVRFQFLAHVNQLNIGGNIYQSIALSEDKFMGEDEVMTCKVYGSGVNFEMGLNTAGQKSYQQSFEWHSNDLIVQDTSLVEGVSKCVIDRKTESDGLLQLSKKWYLLHAIGVVSDNSLQYHKERSISGEKVDLQSNVVVVEEPPSRLLLTLHGVFMTLAWMFFAPVGIFSAKFFRTNQAICGQKLWFQVHRSCMILVLACTVTGIIAIVADMKGFSNANITGDYRNIHPVVGVTTLCLCVGNALISLCRCGPEDKRRIIFNRVHRLCGLISCILAGINTALGTRLERSMLPMEASYLVYAHLGMLLLSEVVHQVLKCRRDLQDKDAKSTSSQGNQHKVERTLLFLATLVCLTLCCLVVYFIIRTQ